MANPKPGYVRVVPHEGEEARTVWVSTRFDEGIWMWLVEGVYATEATGLAAIDATTDNDAYYLTEHPVVEP